MLTPPCKPGEHPAAQRYSLPLNHHPLSRWGFFAQLDVGAFKRLFRCQVPVCTAPWIPACAGMTVVVQRSRWAGEG